jgi:cation diffusion facilitator family transporter
MSSTARTVKRVLWITLTLNLLVAVVKMAYGWWTDSMSMLADGFHSLTDGASNVVGLVGLWIAHQPPDAEHPYGHKKFETLAAVGISAFLLFTCFEILTRTVDRLWEPSGPIVTPLSYTIMGVTFLVNLLVTRYESRKGRELKSDFLVADALHTKSDLFNSFLVVISLYAAQRGYAYLDLGAAVVIAGMIAWMGWHILRHASDVLCDASRLDVESVARIALGVEGVRECHEVRTRGREDAIYLDLHVLADPWMTLEEAHHLAHLVEERIRKEIPDVVDVIVHVEPKYGEAIPVFRRKE